MDKSMRKSMCTMHPAAAAALRALTPESTTTLAEVVARITRGQLVAEGTAAAGPALVAVLCSHHAYPGLVDRLARYGADARRLQFYVSGPLASLTLWESEALLTSYIRKAGAAFVVVDPLSALTGTCPQPLKRGVVKAALMVLGRIGAATGALICVVLRSEDARPDIGWQELTGMVFIAPAESRTGAARHGAA